VKCWPRAAKANRNAAASQHTTSVILMSVIVT
jgi:hypothetical protein